MADVRISPGQVASYRFKLLEGNSHLGLMAQHLTVRRNDALNDVTAPRILDSW